MAMVELYTDIGLSISLVQVKLDEKTPNNDLVVRSDGLYVSGDYNDGSGNIRLQSNQINYLIATDMSPWEEAYNGDNSVFKNHVTCDCNTHRCWNAEWDNSNEEEPNSSSDDDSGSSDSQGDSSDSPSEEQSSENEESSPEENDNSDSNENTIITTSGMPKVKLISGKNENDKFRPEIDWVLPGDFFRIKNGDQWDYYIITEVAPGKGVDICSGCGQIKYKFDGYCDHGNPKYYYTHELNPHYQEFVPANDEHDAQYSDNEITTKNENNYDAPKICEICGQPILKSSKEMEDVLIGYPGNDIVSYALLGTAGDY